MKNVIQTQLTAEDRTAIDTKIGELEALLAGKLSALTPEQRTQYGAINEQNKLLVNKVWEYRQNSPNMSAPEVDWTEFEKDYQARGFLETRLERLSTLVSQMESTKILHDYDNYHDSLTDYSYAQYKKGASEPGFSEKVADLKQFFPRGSKKEATNTDNYKG